MAKRLSKNHIQDKITKLCHLSQSHTHIDIYIHTTNLTNLILVNINAERLSGSDRDQFGQISFFVISVLYLLLCPNHTASYSSTMSWTETFHKKKGIQFSHMYKSNFVQHYCCKTRWNRQRPMNQSKNLMKLCCHGLHFLENPNWPTYSMVDER